VSFKFGYRLEAMRSRGTYLKKISILLKTIYVRGDHWSPQTRQGKTTSVKGDVAPPYPKIAQNPNPLESKSYLNINSSQVPSVII
jgi:hypothetical protein